MSSSKPLITCVIPVYNAEKYLDQGIQSLLGQTYENLEIILVDDKSTDKSWDLCQKYSLEHDNIRVFQNSTNTGGPLRGRERGIKEARGEWITFMDGDDFLKPTYIENLYKTTHNGKFDIAVTGHSKYLANGEEEPFHWDNYSQSTEDRLTVFYQHLLQHDFWTDPSDTVGQNLVRASICKKTDLSKYSNLVYAEDTLMALEFLNNSTNGVNFEDHHDFMWRQVDGSGSNGGFSDRADQTEFYKACLGIFHQVDNFEKISQRCPLISVIVPIYNVEQYLKECIETLVSQTYKNIEIILVNDGSPDKSQVIVEEYLKKDNRIIAIKQENQGLNMARAAGSKVAKGEYITFVDSDDLLNKDHIKYLFENILTNDVDIAVSGFSSFDVKDEIPNNLPEPNYAEQVLRDRKSIIEYYLWKIKTAQSVHPMTAWGKLYKSSIIKNTDWHFSNYRRHEDNFETLQWYASATKGVAVISTPTYNYRINPNSITGKQGPNTGPDGEKLNYFEFIDTLYEKIQQYLNDDSFNIAALNQLTETNTIQVLNFFNKNELDGEDLQQAVNNWFKIKELFNQEIQKRDDLIEQQTQRLNELEGSSSWKLTKPLRKAKRSVQSLRTKLGKK